MQLATSEIVIRVNGEAITLRPTLRAALRLERRYGGFDAIARAVADGSLTVIADVIRESAIDPPDDLHGLLASGPVYTVVNALIDPILDHVFALAGVDMNAPPAKDGTTTMTVDGVTWAEHHHRLFAIATGWLGWTPNEAWSATVAEILAAYQGRLDMLKAIFGGDNEDDPAKALSLDEKFGLVFAGFNRKQTAG